MTTSNTHCQFISTAVILDLIKLSDLSAETESRTHPLNRTRSTAQSDSDIELVAVSIRPPIEPHMLLKVKSKLIGIFEFVWRGMDVDSISNLSAESSYLLSSLLSTATDYQPHPQWGDLITEEAELSFSTLESYNKAMQTIIIRDLTQQDNGIHVFLFGYLPVDLILVLSRSGSVLFLNQPSTISVDENLWLHNIKDIV